MRSIPALHATLGRLKRLLVTLLLGTLTGCSAAGIHLLSHDHGETKAQHDTAAARPAPPSKFSVRVAPYVFHSDVELDRSQPLFRDLAELRARVGRELHLPLGNATVEIYLFENEQHYEAFIHDRYPSLPPRRAFFVAMPHAVGGGEDLLVYTRKGPSMELDLRHELTHAFLHGVLRQVPQWLDEGLAEYFELPADRNGINADHLDHLLHDPDGPYKPDLERLEKLTEVEQMKRPEYREAWLWAHLMLHTTPEAKAVLFQYLQALRDNRNPGSLGPKLAAAIGPLDEAFQRHLNELAGALPTMKSAVHR
jgi:hypothetical protein